LNPAEKLHSGDYNKNRQKRSGFGFILKSKKRSKSNEKKS